MLYDPKWEQKTDRTFKGVSLRALIAWLETQPADAVYRYQEPSNCVVAQFLQSKGYSRSESQVSFGFPSPGDEGYWLDRISCPAPNTFGAALKRARDALCAGGDSEDKQRGET